MPGCQLLSQPHGMRLSSGTYMIQNVRFRYLATLVDSNHRSGVVADTRANEDAGVMWDARKVDTGNYLLQNQRHRNYASFTSTDDTATREYVLSIENTCNEARYWVIIPVNSSRGLYKICDSLDRCWSLEDDISQTPVVLTKYKHDDCQHWKFLLEDDALIDATTGTSCRPSRVAVVAIVSVIIVIAVVPAVVLTRIKENKTAATSTHIPSNISLSGGIEHCPGGSLGDAVKCTFRPQSISPPYRLSYILGPPVTNCNSDFSIQTLIGGTSLVTQQWDDSPIYGPTTPFLDVDIVPSDSLPSYVNWQTTQSWMASRSVPVLLGAGQQVALIIEMMNNVTTGTMSMEYPMAVNGSRFWDIYDVTLYRPTNDTIYHTMNISCDANFSFPRQPAAIPLIPVPFIMRLPTTVLLNQTGSSRTSLIPLIFGPIMVAVTLAVVLRIWGPRRTSKQSRPLPSV